jgi:hypothetical protein
MWPVSISIITEKYRQTVPISVVNLRLKTTVPFHRSNKGVTCTCVTMNSVSWAQALSKTHTLLPTEDSSSWHPSRVPKDHANCTSSLHRCPVTFTTSASTWRATADGYTPNGATCCHRGLTNRICQAAFTFLAQHHTRQLQHTIPSCDNIQQVPPVRLANTPEAVPKILKLIHQVRRLALLADDIQTTLHLASHWPLLME